MAWGFVGAIDLAYLKDLGNERHRFGPIFIHRRNPWWRQPRQEDFVYQVICSCEDDFIYVYDSTALVPTLRAHAEIVPVTAYEPITISPSTAPVVASIKNQ